MILITGAAGKTGRAVIRALASRGIPTRAFVYRQAYAEAVRKAGAGEVVVGDMLDGGAVAPACSGVRSIYHIPPNMSPDEIAMGERMLAAAAAAGVQHFVYHSVLHPQTRRMPHHWCKLQVEELIFESGLPFTILQPTAYMQNILAQRGRIMQGGLYPVPYSAGARISLVDLADVAEAAAIVLTEPGHHAAIYELVGEPSLSQAGVAATLSQALARPVAVEEIPLAAWKKQARTAGLNPDQISTLAQMFEYYDEHGLEGNANVLTWLLGRPPTTLAEFARREFGT